MSSRSERFQLMQKENRKKFLLLQKQLEKEYGDISDKLMEKIQRLVFNYVGPDGTFSKADQDKIQQEIDAINYWLSIELKDWIDRNINESTNMALKGGTEASEHFIKSLIQETASSGNGRTLLKKAMSAEIIGYGSGLVKFIRNAVWQKRWADGYRLSDRIWKLNHLMNDNIRNMVEQCVNEGKSAVNFARAVEDYLEKPGPAWTTGIKPSVTGRGSVKYNALRLARTETNNAYRMAEKEFAKESVITKGIQWHLSASHPNYNYYEICEQYAQEDHCGLGPGVYKPDDIPISPHPNCLCYWTYVTYEGDELIERLKQKYKNTKISFKDQEQSDIIKIGTKISEFETIINNPHQKILSISKHAAKRLKQRNITIENAQKYIDNAIAVIKQKKTNTFKYISKDGTTYLNKEGNLVTTYSRKYFDEEEIKLLKKLRGDNNE